MTIDLGTPLIKPEKLRIRDGRLDHFVYQQDGTKQWMSCANTRQNQLFVAWLQVHDSPTTGSEWERKDA